MQTTSTQMSRLWWGGGLEGPSASDKRTQWLTVAWLRPLQDPGVLASHKYEWNKKNIGKTLFHLIKNKNQQDFYFSWVGDDFIHLLTSTWRTQCFCFFKLVLSVGSLVVLRRLKFFLFIYSPFYKVAFSCPREQFSLLYLWLQAMYSLHLCHFSY